MKVTYIKLQDVDLKYNIDFPELESSVNDLIMKYEIFNVENGLYFVNTPDDAGKGYTEMIIFSDDYFLNNFIKKTEKYLKIYEVLDITKEVKFDTFNNDFFVEKFKSDDSNIYDIHQLEKFLELNMTSDDILDKINLFGIESITETEKMILK